MAMQKQCPEVFLEVFLKILLNSQESNTCVRGLSPQLHLNRASDACVLL